MGVLLDPRDGSGDLIGYFPAGFAELATLNSADVMGTGNGPDGPITWGVEIKKLQELIDSMQNGRLAEQLGKMQEDYDVRYLLVEGHFQACPETGKLQKLVQYDKYMRWQDAHYGNKQRLTFHHFWSWLASITAVSGTSYLHTGSRQETADVTVSLAQFWDKEWEDHNSVKAFRIYQVPGLLIPTRPMLVIKDMAEGVGWEKSVAAAQHFKTIRAAANATEKEWCEVPGINKVLAKRLVEGATTPHATKRRQARTRK